MIKAMTRKKLWRVITFDTVGTVGAVDTIDTEVKLLDDVLMLFKAFVGYYAEPHWMVEDCVEELLKERANKVLRESREYQGEDPLWDLMLEELEDQLKEPPMDVVLDVSEVVREKVDVDELPIESSKLISRKSNGW